MKTLLLCIAAALSLGRLNCPAEDLTTLDGHTYKNVGDFRMTPDGLAFSYDVGSSHAVVPYSQLPDELRKKYPYDPFESGLRQARQSPPINLSKNLAFSMENLEAAKKKALAENKMIGFVLVWDEFFTHNPVRVMGHGSGDALAQFYLTFHNALVLVFVSHERELDKLPAAAKTGIFGPEEGGIAPNMAVVTGDCSQFVCEIPYGAQMATGYDREVIFRKKIADIKKFTEAGNRK